MSFSDLSKKSLLRSVTPVKSSPSFAYNEANILRRLVNAVFLLMQCRDNFVKALFFDYKLQVTNNLILSLMAGHPSASVLSEITVARFALVALRTFVHI